VIFHAATMRMRLAFALLGIVFLGANAALAQDPRTTAVQQAARAFLALTDRDDGMASWQLAGKQFQNAITDVRWTEALHGVRVPLGSVVERALLSTKFTTNFAGAAAEGDYALLLFRTSFDNRTDARETVTLERESDGAWRVIGYFIR
jgi:hypothetical protein